MLSRAALAVSDLEAASTTFSSLAMTFRYLAEQELVRPVPLPPPPRKGELKKALWVSVEKESHDTVWSVEFSPVVAGLRSLPCELPVVPVIWCV